MLLSATKTGAKAGMLSHFDTQMGIGVDIMLHRSIVFGMTTIKCSATDGPRHPGDAQEGWLPFGEHTLSHMRTAMWGPALFQRVSLEEWRDSGSEQMQKRVREKLMDLLISS